MNNIAEKKALLRKNKAQTVKLNGLIQNLLDPFNRAADAPLITIDGRSRRQNGKPGKTREQEDELASKSCCSAVGGQRPTSAWYFQSHRCLPGLALLSTCPPTKATLVFP